MGWKLIRRDCNKSLLDIDGDTCHHAHNAAKKLCAPFQGLLERLLHDLYTDFKWSTDQRETLQQICLIAGVKYTKVPQYVPHRWLSILDVSLSTLNKMDALILFYASFLVEKPSATRAIIKKVMDRLFLNSTSCAALTAIQLKLSRKSMTPEGQQRKLRITSAIFKENTTLKLIMGFYTSVLPLLKAYVCLFEHKDPMVHLLYEKQHELFTNFLSLFVKPEEILEKKKNKKLASCDISQLKRLKPSDMFAGSIASKIIKENPQSHAVILFKEHMVDGFVACAQILQRKMPLTNELPKSCCLY